jgi:hypothetical protein
MQNCWSLNQNSRPTFSQICQQLAVILESATSDYGYVDAIRTLDTSLEPESTSSDSVT